VWKDETMVKPPPLVNGLIRYNPKIDLAKWVANGISIEQDFKPSKGGGLLPCDGSIAALVGGLRPYHGLAPVLNNAKRAASSSSSSKKGYAATECNALITAAEEMMTALSRSVADESFCVVRSLVEPQALVRDTVEVMLGRSLGNSKNIKGSNSHINAPSSISSNVTSVSSSLGRRHSVRLRRQLSNADKGSNTGSMALISTLPPLVGLHLRLQENIALQHDVDWEVECVARIASQLVDRYATRSTGSSSKAAAVVFAVATDSPSKLADIVARVRRTSAVCQKGGQNACRFVSMADVGTMGHISNKETQGATSVVRYESK